MSLLYDVIAPRKDSNGAPMTATTDPKKPVVAAAIDLGKLVELSCEAASLLAERIDSLLLLDEDADEKLLPDGVSKVETKQGTRTETKGGTKTDPKKGTIVYEFEWEFDTLLSELIKTIVKEVQRLVAEKIGAKIRKKRPDERRPGPGVHLLRRGCLSTSENEIVILLPLRTCNDARKAEIRLQSDVIKKGGCGTELLGGLPILVYPRARFLAPPVWIPFLMLPLPLELEDYGCDSMGSLEAPVKSEPSNSR